MPHKNSTPGNGMNKADLLKGFYWELLVLF
jgi:hypothetical protein